MNNKPIIEQIVEKGREAYEEQCSPYICDCLEYGAVPILKRAANDDDVLVPLGLLIRFTCDLIDNCFGANEYVARELNVDKLDNDDQEVIEFRERMWQRIQSFAKGDNNVSHHL